MVQQPIQLRPGSGRIALLQQQVEFKPAQIQGKPLQLLGVSNHPGQLLLVLGVDLREAGEVAFAVVGNGFQFHERAVAFVDQRLALLGEVDRWLSDMPAVDAEEKLRAALAASRSAHVPDAGPHRSDLAVTFGCAGHPSHGLVAAMCSTGEQKALLISIVLASARLQAVKRGFPPILLLDEIAAHLDPDRREALFAEILAMGAQAWMTGTESSMFAALGDTAQYWRVRQNTLVPSSRLGAF